MLFTDKFLKTLPITGSTYRKLEGGSEPGFGIRVTANGAKTFILQYSYEGTKRFLRLGGYPEISLSEARTKAKAARTLVDQGIDPQESNKTDAREARLRGTVKQLVDVYIAHLKESGKRSADEVKRSLYLDVVPAIGDMPARDVTPLHCREIIYKLIKRDAEKGANRLRAYMLRMFKIGIYHDNDPRSVGASVLFGITHNPVENIPKNAAIEKALDRALSWAELKKVWSDDALILPFRLAVRLILSTGGQRPGEVIFAPWAEFDLAGKMWTIPAERTKNKREHMIPLTDMALAILKQLKSMYPRGKFLFPSRHNPKSNKPWSDALFSRSILDYCTATAMLHWTPRDLRRTVKTRMGEIGISKDVRDRLQNHALDDVSTRHYDRWTYLPEKRAALDAWCKHIEEAIAE